MFPSRATEPRARRARRPGGFTLIEILIALTIAAVLFAALFSAFGQSLRAGRLVDAYSRALLLAQSKLDEVTARGDLADGETSGRFAPPAGGAEPPRGGRVFTWRLRVVPHVADALGPAASALLEPLDVTLSVSWTEAGKERSVMLETLALRARR